MDSVKRELCDDTWGVCFAGKARCDEISELCLTQVKAGGQMFATLTSDIGNELDQMPSVCTCSKGQLESDHRGMNTPSALFDFAVRARCPSL